MRKTKKVVINFADLTLHCEAPPSELQRKRKELFGNNHEVTSVLSDLSVCAGIPSYWQALPKMSQSEAKVLTKLVGEYNEALMKWKNNEKRSRLEQQSVRRKMTRILNSIIAGK